MSDQSETQKLLQEALNVLKGFYDKAFVQASPCFLAIEFFAAMQSKIESGQPFHARKSSANVSESNKYQP